MTDVDCEEVYCLHNQEGKCKKDKIKLYIGKDMEFHCSESRYN